MTEKDKSEWREMINKGYEYDEDRRDWFKAPSEMTDNEMCRWLAEDLGVGY